MKLTPMNNSKPKVKKSDSRLFDQSDVMLSSTKKGGDEDLMKNTPVDAYRPRVNYQDQGD